MIDSILNIFRKDKVRVYAPYNDCSGPVSALAEFEAFKELSEKISGKKIVWLKSYSIFGFERIKYKVEE